MYGAPNKHGNKFTPEQIGDDSNKNLPAIIEVYRTTDNQGNAHGLHRNCSHSHDDDTDDEPWPESFDPLKPEQPFTPIFKQPGNSNANFRLEEELNLIPYRRPQRNQKRFGTKRYYRNKPAQLSKSFSASLRGPMEFYPSLQSKNLVLITPEKLIF